MIFYDHTVSILFTYSVFTAYESLLVLYDIYAQSETFGKLTLKPLDDVIGEGDPLGSNYSTATTVTSLN